MSVDAADTPAITAEAAQDRAAPASPAPRHELAAVDPATAPTSPAAPASAAAEALVVGGLQPFTTIDYPGALAAVVFVQGCPWRCGYCHNPELLPARGAAGIPWAQVEDFLRRRRGLLDGVVFSGGEPTTQARLPEALAAVRDLGFAAGLHSGGMYPAKLAAALPLLDWVGLDIKALPARYPAITGAPGSGERVWQSLQQLLDGGVACECRTTWHPRLYPEEELLRLAEELADRGVRHWVVQECRGAAFPADEWQLHVPPALAERFQSFTVRRA